MGALDASCQAASACGSRNVVSMAGYSSTAMNGARHALADRPTRNEAAGDRKRGGRGRHNSTAWSSPVFSGWRRAARLAVGHRCAAPASQAPQVGVKWGLPRGAPPEMGVGDLRDHGLAPSTRGISTPFTPQKSLSNQSHSGCAGRFARVVWRAGTVVALSRGQSRLTPTLLAVGGPATDVAPGMVSGGGLHTLSPRIPTHQSMPPC
jgi:hypothetical protein